MAAPRPSRSRSRPASATGSSVSVPRLGRGPRLLALDRCCAGVRGVLWQIGLASVVINLLALATPLFMMTVYNKVINHAALQTLDVLAIGMVTLVAFELLLRALRGYITAHTGARLEAAIGSDVVHHLLHLPYRFFEATPGAVVLERRAPGRPAAPVPHRPPAAADRRPRLRRPVRGWCCWPSHRRWRLVTAAAMPVFAALSVLGQRSQSAHQRAHARAAGAKATALGEAVTQALTVKSLALEPDMKRRFERHLVRSAWTGLQSGRIAHLAGSLAQALQHVTALVLVYLGARMIVAGDMTVGAMVAASILSARALAPMRQIAGAWTPVPAGARGGRPPRRAAGRARRGQRPAGRSASCRSRASSRSRTSRSATPAPSGRRWRASASRVAPGTMLGIAGAPGSGKSTLVPLLLGLEMPEAGRVLLDGLDLAALSPVGYRGQIGVVPQEVQLFSGTIAENIAMGAVDRSRARVVAAARFVGADGFIRRLPEGYETVLGERGSGLSLGQRQLIAVARAIVRNPRMLVLDEATSALDPAAEAHLLANIRRAGSGRTVVLVTHRPAVLAACDRVILLEHGRVAAVGPPGEVLPRTPLGGPRRPAGGRLAMPACASRTRTRRHRARELLDGGPPLLAGALVAIVAALFAALLGWLAWAQVEEVVHADGRRRARRAGEDRQPPARRPRGADPCPRGRPGRGGRRAGDARRRGGAQRASRARRAGCRCARSRSARLAAEAAGRPMLVEAALDVARPDLVAAQRALLQARDASFRSRREALEKAEQTRERRAAHGRGRGRPAAQQPGAAQAAARGGARRWPSGGSIPR